MSKKVTLPDKLRKGFDFAKQNQMIIFSFLFAAEPRKARFRALRSATKALPLETTAFEKAGETFNVANLCSSISKGAFSTS